MVVVVRKIYKRCIGCECSQYNYINPYGVIKDLTP
uniref:Uncharacterized protein n=1 Tax=Acinetobacter phage vB_Ab_02_KEN_01 TaxID=3143011 RepID=A0AAU8KUL2_9VIRU